MVNIDAALCLTVLGYLVAMTSSKYDAVTRNPDELAAAAAKVEHLITLTPRELEAHVDAILKRRSGRKRRAVAIRRPC